MNNGLDKLLLRTNLQISLEEFLEVVKKTYDISQIVAYEPLLEGYENANIKIDTDKGKYVIKIFAKGIIELQAKDSEYVTQEALKIGVPFPHLLKGANGYLHKIMQKDIPVWYYLMEFIEGKNFEKQKVTMGDIIAISDYLAKFNTLNLPIHEVYDSWGNKNILVEYKKVKNLIPQDIFELISPVIVEVANIDFSGFHTSIIHGDLQRKHVLKNKDNKYCFLDLGCMRNDAIVYDISILLAWFCLSPDTWDMKDEIVKKVLERYQKIHSLTQREIDAVFPLIKAAYAAYLMKTSVLIRQGDTSQETREWHEKAKEMLEKCNKWQWVLL